MQGFQTLKWLLFFYSIPATPVKNRVKIWRKLQKTGAVQLKGGVYVLPYLEDNHEALQWMLAELPGLKGEGLLVTTETIEPLQQQEIIALFNEQRHLQYQEVGKKIDELSGRIDNLRKGGKDKKSISLFRQFEKIQADFHTVHNRDFFKSESGQSLVGRLQALKGQLETLTAIKKGTRTFAGNVLSKGIKIEKYSNLRWVTRKRPFVDRMACAWLIRRFIDPQATFVFRDEGDLKNLKGANEVAFDVRYGDFTHFEDLCTFEVLLKSFGLTANGLNALAAIVHNIDIKDEKFSAPEIQGIEMLLRGIRKKALSDNETLEQGIEVFEALYLSLTEIN
ncbi:MAG: chromate resistance protein [Proteobacteria bacterium]|nr:chromate resistance protein [Pseudomonadota bacterium]